jgi:hypothetical protein
MRYYNQITIFIFLFIIPPNVFSQTIDFEILDCSVYKKEKVDIEKTREAREECEEEVVLLTFYPDTDVIESELGIFGLRNKILKLEKDSYGKYSTEIELDGVLLFIDLDLKQVFGYIRGGEFTLTGKNSEKDIISVIVEFSRK